MIFLSYFLNCMEVQQTAKFSRTYANFCHGMSHLQRQSSYRKGNGIPETVATSRFMRDGLLCLPEMPKRCSSWDPILSRASHPMVRSLSVK